MTTRDKLETIAETYIDRGYDLDTAIDKACDNNPELVKLLASDNVRQHMKKQNRTDWMYPPEWEQMHMELGDEILRLPDRRVRIIEDDGEETFVAARFATLPQQRTSIELQIREHAKQMKSSESSAKQISDVEAKLINAGADTENLTWDEIKHKNTVCGRCGLGRDPHDPFVKGHKVAVAHGGTYDSDNLYWLHNSCNQKQGTDPDTTNQPESN